MPASPVCAYCRQQPVDPVYRPFCGKRCKMADLGRWLQGDYRISDPAGPSPDAFPPSDEDEDDDMLSEH